MKRNGILSILGLAVMLAALAPTGNVRAANTTAQSIMVFNNDTNGQLDLAAQQFVLLGSETWSYDNTAAKTYFTNAWDGNAPPSPTCNGTGCPPGDPTWIPNSCSTPSAPGAPAADANKLNPVVGQNSCTFFDGGTLSGDTYTQDVTVNGDCNVCQPCTGGGTCGGNLVACPTIGTQKYKLVGKNADFKFTYTYNITPTTNPVEARTAWNLDSNNNSPAHVDVSANVAGQSTLRKGANDCTATTCSSGSWKFKASHTITDASGLRVTGMKVGVYDSNDGLVGTEKVQGTDFAFSLGTGDYFYAQNAGTSGDTNQLLNGALVSDIQQGDVCTTGGGNRDDHCGNDAVLGEKAVMDAPVGFDLSTEGDYTLRVSGTVKGNAGTVNQSFSVCSSLTISAGSCSTATNNCQ